VAQSFDKIGICSHNPNCAQETASEVGMSIVIVETQNLFDHFPEMILHPVNCVSVGRDSFSKQIKKAFPNYFAHYQRQVLRKHLFVSRPEAVDLCTLFGTNTCVTLPIQGHWREVVLPESVKTALKKWKEILLSHKSRSVGMPEFEGPPHGWLKHHLEVLLSDVEWDVTVYILPRIEEQPFAGISAQLGSAEAQI
jgi:hypothetical protein